MFHLIFSKDQVFVFSADVKTECCRSYMAKSICIACGQKLAGLVLLAAPSPWAQAALCCFLNTEAAQRCHSDFFLVRNRSMAWNASFSPKPAPSKEDGVYSVRIS